MLGIPQIVGLWVCRRRHFWGLQKAPPVRRWFRWRLSEHMPNCPQCRVAMARAHRSRFRKVIYSAIFVCPRCRLRLAVYYRFLARQNVRRRFLFSGHSRCVGCGSESVYHLERRDPVDPLSKDVLGLFQFLLGAPLKKCPDCRVQYYDWRPARKRVDS
jgi:hypothetical protein